MPWTMADEIRRRNSTPGGWGGSDDPASAEERSIPLEFLKPDPTPAPEPRNEAERRSLKLRQRSVGLCAEAIGRRVRVRLGRNELVSGVIVEAEPSSQRQAGRSIIQRFRVVLECGESKQRREVVVEKLPY